MAVYLQLLIYLGGSTYDCAGVENGTATLDSCGVCSEGTTGITACKGTIQFEDNCSIDGVVEATNTGFYGDGYANVTNAVGSAVTVSVIATAAGTYSFDLRYANGGTSTRLVSVEVNSVLVDSIDCSAQEAGQPGLPLLLILR